MKTFLVFGIFADLFLLNCESLAQIERAAGAGLDLIVLPRSLDWAAFAALARQSKLPVFAQSNELELARDHGAHGIALATG